MASREGRAKALWTSAVTVALVAVVLIVLGMMGPLFKGGKKPVATAPTTTVTPVSQSAALYSQALAAQRSGDTTRAADLAAQAVAADPSNTAAKSLLDSLTSAKSSASTPSTTTPSSESSSATTSSDAKYLTKISNLASLLPAVVPGFELDSPVRTGSDITRSGVPTDLKSTVRTISWAVHDRKTATAANHFVAATSKAGFPHNPSTVSIAGHSGYFGTDGTQFATVSFVRGRYVFEVLASARDVSPVKIKAAALLAATQFRM